MLDHAMKLLDRSAPLRKVPLGRIVLRDTDAPLPDGEEIAALAASISRFGLLHPLTVRRRGDRLELVCGRRRYSAAKLCGLKTVPCRVLELTDSDCAAARIAENLRRREPDFWDTALMLKELIYRFGYTIEDAAVCAGMCRADAERLLHILALPEPMLEAIRETKLTLRHAAALLRLPEGGLREAAFCEMAYQSMSPADAERYVGEILDGETRRPTIIVRDVRLFLNSLTRNLDALRTSGIPAEFLREDADNCIKLTIRLGVGGRKNTA